MTTLHPIPFADPVAAFARWAEAPWAMLFDSAGEDAERGRYAFIAVDPYRTVASVDGRTEIDGRPADIDPFDALARELALVPVQAAGRPVPFVGGAAGMLGYETGRHLERAPARHRVPSGQPDMAMGFYDAVAAFDRRERRAWVIAARPQAGAKARALAAALADSPPLPRLPPPSRVRWRAELDRAEYLRRVERAIAYIRAGDVFQVNFTARFLAARPQGPADFDLYRRLRAANPAPFAAFLRCGETLTVASASPERFLSLAADGLIQARPIKGTRVRGGCAPSDAAAAAELAASVKDRAENLMITDLLRNDIGRVAEIGSVRVPVLCGVESFATIHHLVSVVEGRLRAGLGPVDLLRAAFPGGSVTGAPKVRAMEIIDELEPAARGPYCGAVGWIGFDGAMDTSILIRSLVLTPDTIVAQAGGGIVADSVPEAEYAELMAKLAPALAALPQEDE
ncbi:MAG: aminodeoxychorismate synthase component I [Magnetospirillum sp.]|nr:aminodeoxychorismate synthase component I [Magnetospirillum sp.]